MTYFTVLRNCRHRAQVKGKLGEAGELVSTTLPEAGGRVGKGAADALKGAASSDEIGDPIKEAFTSAEKVRYHGNT